VVVLAVVVLSKLMDCVIPQALRGMDNDGKAGRLYSRDPGGSV
jgi:hypothetical protein